MVWDKGVRYFYYKHGPLARTILGQNQVQGLDYVYTLQGWLKGVNSTSVGDGSFDVGQDGSAGSGNSNIARDAFGFSLNYFSGDYKSIGGTIPFAGIKLGNDLFNGNINAIAVNIPKVGEAKVYSYRYDQLNRLVGMDAYNGLSNATNAFSPVSINDYKERVSYDANGNIQSYLRNGNAARLSMDNLTYTYKANTNKLDKVTDAAPDASAIEYDTYNDIKRGQADGNYLYDEIGNLISDVSESITNIAWTVYGKIAAVTKKDGAKIFYTYDASGNRISKAVSSKKTFYVRDAGGNVMSIYSKDASINNGDLSQTELHLYGSSRLGVYNLKNNVAHPDLNTGRIITFTAGNKSFELSNHLGNVLATVSDKKMQHSSNNAIVDYFTADVVFAQDYYPGGMFMPGRQNQTGNTPYRYGFQKQEKDNEIYGNGNSYYFKYRLDDTRLVRFLSVDPLTNKFPQWSPYSFSGNQLIDAVELEGLEPQKVIKKAEEYTGTPYEFGGKNPAFEGGLPEGMSNETYLKEVGYPSSIMKNKGGFGSRALNPNYTNSVNLNQYLTNGSTSCGIDCSGLAVNSFNADKEKLMKDFNVYTTSAAKMKVAFIKAQKNGTGNLGSDFNKIQQGDPVFNFHKNGTVSHVMISTGGHRFVNGRTQIQVIHSPQTGEFVKMSWRTVGKGWTYGHTNRTNETNQLRDAWNATISSIHKYFNHIVK